MRRILTIGTAVLTAASAVLSGCGAAKEHPEGREAETVQEAGLSEASPDSCDSGLKE